MRITLYEIHVAVEDTSCSALWEHLLHYLNLMGLLRVIGKEHIKFPGFWDKNPCTLVTYTDTNAPQGSKR